MLRDCGRHVYYRSISKCNSRLFISFEVPFHLISKNTGFFKLAFLPLLLDDLTSYVSSRTVFFFTFLFNYSYLHFEAVNFTSCNFSLSLLHFPSTYSFANVNQTGTLPNDSENLVSKL